MRANWVGARHDQQPPAPPSTSPGPDETFPERRDRRHRPVRTPFTGIPGVTRDWMLAATEGPTSSSWWRSTIGSPSTFAERERALAAADPTVLRIWPQAGRGDRRDLDVPDEVDPGNHRVAHPRPQGRVAGRRRGRPGDGRDLRLPGDPCQSGARPRQCTDTKSVTTGNPGQARPGQLRRHQHRPARHPREDPAQATAVPPRTPRRISRPDRADPPASSATTSTDPGLLHSVGGGPPGRLSRSLPGGPPEARSEAPCSR